MEISSGGGKLRFYPEIRHNLWHTKTFLCFFFLLMFLIPFNEIFLWLHLHKLHCSQFCLAVAWEKGFAESFGEKKFFCLIQEHRTFKILMINWICATLENRFHLMGGLALCKQRPNGFERFSTRYNGGCKQQRSEKLLQKKIETVSVPFLLDFALLAEVVCSW